MKTIASIVILNCFFNIFYAQNRSATNSDFEYEDCGCQFSIKLKIYNGINGSEVPQSDKFTVGAVTVANLNDTDGDTNDDYMDANGVKASATGRDELDLIKVVIESTGTIPSNCTEKVRLDITGRIKLYTDEFKSVEENDREFDIVNLPRTVYVEALKASTSNNDIIIKAFIGNTEVDKVSATAIWVKGEMKYVSGNTPSPCSPSQTFLNGTVANNICSRVSNNGDLYGLGYFASTNPEYGGRILVEFELMPATASSFGLNFDITRRLDQESGEMISGTGVFNNTSTNMFLPQVEMPNDDSGNFDEDVVTSFPIFYSYDAPANEIGNVQPQGATSPISYVKWIGDFEEFVRVSFTPIPANNPGSEQIHGTRCSDLVKWCHGRSLVAKARSGAIDPYINSSQQLDVINSARTSSAPIRIMGGGDGDINVTLLPNATTQGYSLFFPSIFKCELRSGPNIIQSVSIVNSAWTLEDTGKIKVTVSNNSTNPFVAGTQLNFSTLVSDRLFNAVKIR